jgi:hypothetical protein
MLSCLPVLARATPPHPVGGPCRSTADCTSGTECAWNTCEYPSPCRATWSPPGGAPTRTQIWTHDPQGRILGSVIEENGKPAGTETYTWSPDGRVCTIEVRDRGALRTVRLEHDATGNVTRMLETLGGKTEETTYRWPQTWDCPLPEVAMRDLAGQLIMAPTTTCQGDRRETVWKRPDGTVSHTSTSVFQGGRMIERTTQYFVDSVPRAARFTIERDARGAVQRLSYDFGADGTVDQVEVRDHSCFVVGPEGVKRGP